MMDFLILVFIFILNLLQLFRIQFQLYLILLSQLKQLQPQLYRMLRHLIQLFRPQRHLPSFSTIMLHQLSTYQPLPCLQQLLHLQLYLPQLFHLLQPLLQNQIYPLRLLLYLNQLLFFLFRSIFLQWLHPSLYQLFLIFQFLLFVTFLELIQEQVLKLLELLELQECQWHQVLLVKMVHSVMILDLSCHCYFNLYHFQFYFLITPAQRFTLGFFIKLVLFLILVNFILSHVFYVLATISLSSKSLESNQLDWVKTYFVMKYLKV